MMTLKGGPRIWSLIFSITVGFFNTPVLGLSISYVSPETKSDLNRLFETSTTPFSLSESSWMCEMFGVRSGLQHQKNLSLYRFKTLKKDILSNEGDSPNSQFKFNKEHTELTANNGQVTESIRLHTNNILVAQFTRSTDKTVLAYAKCQLQNNKLPLTASHLNGETVP